MESLFFDTRELDKQAREKFNLSEELMMENAACGLEKYVNSLLRENYEYVINKPAVLILCGKGNNGADGYALARRFCCERLNIFVLDFEEPKTQLGILQKERAVTAGVQFIKPADLSYFLDQNSIDVKIVVDCIFGIGFHGQLSAEIEDVINQINQLNENVKKVSCDVPTGLDINGNASGTVFKADLTVTMGAKKICLYSDKAKDFTGTVCEVHLGIHPSKYKDFDTDGKYYLLSEKDMELPERKIENANKGSFGHTAIFCGEKIGAGVIAGKAALKFGSGLVTLISDKKHEFENRMVPFELMTSEKVPEKCNSIAIGMGFGRTEKIGFLNDYLNDKNMSFVLDADVFYNREIVEFLEKFEGMGKIQYRENLVLTPHPKEFASLLNMCGFGDFDTNYVIENRLELVRKFCEKYKGVVLLLKGANSVIGRQNDSEFTCLINPIGSVALSKAGSGDVLSGMIASLMAQKQNAFEAAKNGSLAHAAASQKFVEKYALTPFELIEKLD